MCVVERRVFVIFLYTKTQSGTELHKGNLPAGGFLINLPAARSDPQASKIMGSGWIFCDWLEERKEVAKNTKELPWQLTEERNKSDKLRNAMEHP